MIRISRLHLYVATVGVAGIALLLVLAAGGGATRFLDDPAVSLMLVALALHGELRPIHIKRDAGDGIELSMSTPFVLALLLTAGTAAAALALAAATVLADVIHRKPAIRVVFNAAQYTLSLAACGLVLHIWAGGSDALELAALTLGDLALVLLAGLVFFAVNATLPVVAVALDQGQRPTMVLRRDLGYQIATAGVLTALAPVVVLVSQHSVPLLPVLMLPAIAVHWSAKVSLKNEWQSQHDTLTGLPNRSMFHMCVADALGKEPRSAIMLVDLDHFKEVNDTLGHRTGDKLLVQVGRRLTDTLGPRATVARLGGDEFALFLPAMPDAETAMATGDLVCRTLQEPFVVEDFALSVEGSIGVALYPDDGTDSGMLLRCADVAMYLAKETPRGCHRYSPERDEHSRQRLALVSQVRDAIDTGQFVLYYQPKMDLRSDMVVGAEALVRWQHPELGLLQPTQFIPLIEATVHMLPLTRHIMGLALAQCKAWHALGLPLSVSVNVPANLLHADSFAGEVAELLDVHDVRASCLELEVTESTIMSDRARGMTTLHRLNTLGVRLAIDDFGTGYSSLTYLKQLPVHTLKIDKSFVMGLAPGTDDEKIVQSTIALAKNLDLETVAEGVSNLYTLRFLRTLGCELAQGFYIGKPMPASGLLPLLRYYVASLPSHSTDGETIEVREAVT